MHIITCTSRSHKGKSVPPRRPNHTHMEFETAAASVDVTSMHDLGVLLWTGTGVKEDKARAVELFRRAVDRGHSASMHKLGLALASGYGDVPPDASAAAQMYEAAAGRGCVLSQYQLAMCCIDGCGTPVDKNRGMALLHTSAALGCSLAQERLVRLYTIGRLPKKVVAGRAGISNPRACRNLLAELEAVQEVESDDERGYMGGDEEDEHEDGDAVRPCKRLKPCALDLLADVAVGKVGAGA